MRNVELPPLIATLLEPGVYPHAVDRVELIETHISWVFLAGDRAYKLKKPVDLGFLDFTTLERRRFFCEEEIRLNRRLTEDIYLGVAELRGDGRLHFGGTGPVREVAVVMRRLPHDRMLDRLVQAGTAPPELLDDIGHLVARFHAGAATGGEIDLLGGLDTVRENWEENFAQTAHLSAEILPEPWRRALRDYVSQFLTREADRFAARVAAGRSRDCHGDLQAQHVCCADRIQIFDCIEFNHRFRFGDTASEVAFLAMDLDRLGRSDLALRFLNAYLEESGDYEAVPLLDFYCAYRAFVRGKVLSFQAAAHPEVRPGAHALFEQAVGYVGRPHGPRVVITTGVMGSGKSTVAREVAQRLRAILVRTDAVRKRLAGRPLRERGQDPFGEGLYTEAMGQRTYFETLNIAEEIVRTGWPVVIDGSFSAAAERSAARATAASLGVPYTALWCKAPDPVIALRLRHRAADPREISDGREDILGRHRARYEPPRGEPGVIRIDTADDVRAAVGPALARLD